MELTPEQREQVRHAKASGERRVTLRFTAQQREAWEAAVREELAGKEDNLAQFRKVKAAAERPGFFGDVRRAMAVSRRPLDELAGEIGVDPRLLSDFRAGDADLPAAALDRLIDALGLRLMQEIAREKIRSRKSVKIFWFFMRPGQERQGPFVIPFGRCGRPSGVRAAGRTRRERETVDYPRRR